VSRYGLDGCPGCPDCHVDHDCDDCGHLHGSWSGHEADAARRAETIGERVLLEHELRKVLSRWGNTDQDVVREVLDGLAWEIPT